MNDENDEEDEVTLKFKPSNAVTWKDDLLDCGYFDEQTNTATADGGRLNKYLIKNTNLILTYRFTPSKSITLCITYNRPRKFSGI